MSKNTASNAFRKIDVDQFNEDNFKDEETPQDAGFAGVNESEVSNLLSSGKAGEALKLLLSSAPIGSKNQADKICVSCLNYGPSIMSQEKTPRPQGSLKLLWGAFHLERSLKN